MKPPSIDDAGNKSSIKAATHWFQGLSRERKAQVRNFIRDNKPPRGWRGTSVEYAYHYSSPYQQREAAGQIPLFDGIGRNA